MILVDSSVWIDYFRNIPTRSTDRLDDLLGVEPVLVGDLILTEVLQGFRSEREFNQALRLFQSTTVIPICSTDIAILAARNFRHLRSLGLTVRKTVDCLIATRCIADGHALLFSDRDFIPFVDHLGLEAA